MRLCLPHVHAVCILDWAGLDLLQASVTLPALVLLGEAAQQTEVPPAVDVSVDVLPMDVSISGRQLHWAAQIVAALPNLVPDAGVGSSDPGGAC